MLGDKIENCGICKYYWPKHGVNDKIETKSYCHRFPEKVKVNASYWCGEFDEQIKRIYD